MYFLASPVRGAFLGLVICLGAGCIDAFEKDPDIPTKNDGMIEDQAEIEEREEAEDEDD